MGIDQRGEGEAVDAADGEHTTLSRRSLLGAGGALGALAALTTGSLPVSAEQAAPSSADAALLKAFDAFLATLRRSAELAFAQSASRRPYDRAAGLRHILDNLSLGLAFHLHDADRLHPELMHYFDPSRKQGGDNQDALYVGANLDGSQTYRIHGDRGTAKFFAMTVVEKGPTPWGGRSTAYLFGHDMKVEPDGRFEVILSPDPHAGNWLKLEPNTLRVTVRQFFADWENERPMRAMIERLGPPVPPPLLTAEKILAALETTGAWIENTVSFWQRMIAIFARKPNVFQRWRDLDTSKVDATPGGDPWNCYWSVPEDSALIVRVTPPACEFWNLEFNNPWWETHDYRYRLSGTNVHHAVLEEGGELIAVVSHDDPGVPNWLDPGGFTEGMMGMRWMFAETRPQPQCTLVKRSALERALPRNVRKITPEQRREQLAARRRGIYNRFHWM